MNVPVVRIKSTNPAQQGEFVEINASDFDSAVHEKWVPAEPAPAPLPPPPVTP
jgi:hypothetical protein